MTTELTQCMRVALATSAPLKEHLLRGEVHLRQGGHCKSQRTDGKPLLRLTQRQPPRILVGKISFNHEGKLRAELFL